jgi:hypothetical protein
MRFHASPRRQRFCFWGDSRWVHCDAHGRFDVAINKPAGGIGRGLPADCADRRGIVRQSRQSFVEAYAAVSGLLDGVSDEVFDLAMIRKLR